MKRKKFIVMLSTILMLSVLNGVLVMGQEELFILEEGETGEISLKQQRFIESHSNIAREYFLSKEILEAAIEKETKTKKIDIIQSKFLESEKNFFDSGFIKLSPEETNDEFGIQSIAGDYEFTALDLYYYPDNDIFLLHSAGNWINDSWKDDGNTSSSGWKNMGRENAYGIHSLHRDINTFNREFQTVHYNYEDENDFTDWSNTASTFSSDRGWAWEFQDQYLVEGLFSKSITDYTSWRQLGWYYFNFTDGIPCNSTISFAVNYGHTWSTTFVTGFSHLGISWSSGYNRWDKSETATYNMAQFCN